MPQNEGQTVKQWLEQNMGEVEQAQEFAMALLPDEPAGLALALSRAQSEYARIGFLLADAETFVLKAHAASILNTRKVNPDLTWKEREIVSKADPDYLQVLRLRDNISIIVQALKNKSFAIMNQRNNTCDPRMST